MFNWLLVLLMKNSNTLIVTRIYNLKVLASLSHQKSWFYGLKLRNYYYFMTIFLMTLPGIIWQNRIWDEARRNESRAEVPKREDVAQWTIISRPKLPNTMGSIWICVWVWVWVWVWIWIWLWIWRICISKLSESLVFLRDFFIRYSSRSIKLYAILWIVWPHCIGYP